MPFDRFCNAIWFWAVRRVKDVEVFERELNHDHREGAAVVTAEELDRDAQSFMAFAGAFGVKPAVPRPIEAAVVESGDSEG